MSQPAATREREPILIRIALSPLRAIERARGWRRFVLVAVYAIIALVIGAILWRRSELAGLPDVGEPFDVAVVRWPAPVPGDRNAFSSYQRAAARFQDMTAAVGSSFNNANLSWARSDATLRAWVAANDEAISLMLAGSERPEFVPELPKSLSVQDANMAKTELARRIGWIGTAGLFKAGRLRAEGDHAGAWKLLKAVARASRHIEWSVPPAGRTHGIMLAQYAREPLAEWACDKGTTAAMLRQALADLAAAEGLTPPLSSFYRQEYLGALESLTPAKPFFTSEPPQPANPAQRPFIPSFPALDAFLHGEPERSRRVLNLLIANDLAWCDRPGIARPVLAISRLQIYEGDPAAPESTRALAPDELARWADSALITPTLTWRLGDIEKWDGIDRWSMNVLTESVAVSLFTKETGRPPASGAEALKRYRPSPGDSQHRDDGPRPDHTAAVIACARAAKPRKRSSEGRALRGLRMNPISWLSSRLRRQPGRRSKDVQSEVMTAVPALLAPVVPAVRVAEDSEDPVTAVIVAVVRALNLRNDPLFARIAIPAVVESVILESVPRDLRRDVRPMEIVGPVLRLGRLHSAKGGERESQSPRFEPREARHNTPPCREHFPKPWPICHTFASPAKKTRDFLPSEGTSYDGHTASG